MPLKDRLCALYRQTTERDTGPWSLLRGLDNSLAGLQASSNVSVDGQTWIDGQMEDGEWKEAGWKKWGQKHRHERRQRTLNQWSFVEKTSRTHRTETRLDSTATRETDVWCVESRRSDAVRYLHSDAEVHHGHAGVAMPAHVHGGVTAVTLALQRRARAAELLLRLQLSAAVLRQLCGTTGSRGLRSNQDRQRMEWFGTVTFIKPQEIQI